MEQISRSKLTKAILVLILIKTTLGSINLNSKRLLSQITIKSYPINPLNNSHRFYALSNISLRSITGLKNHEYHPDIGFGYRISRNLAIEGGIFNKSSGDVYDQVINGGAQYFFGGTDTLSWVCSIKKSRYNSIKNYSVNSIVFDVSKWINYKNKFLRFGLGSSFYKKNDFSNNLIGQVNFAFMNILIPIRVLQLGIGLEVNQHSSLKFLFMQKEF